MSQSILETPTDLNEPVDPNDRFAYGWRYVRKILPDGSETRVQVPLTLEDILHPQEEDFRLQNDRHTQDLLYLRGVLQARLAEKMGAFVLSDCRVAWNAEGTYGHGPDIAVIFKVRKYGEWGTFNVVDEGTRPALIIEVTSPSTRSTDLVDKRREYAAEEVPHYVIADIRTRGGVRSIIFHDYRLPASSETYAEQPIGESGRIWLPEVGLSLGVESGSLALYEPDGERKGTYVEVERGRIEAERSLMEEAETRIVAESALQEEIEARRTIELALSDAERKAEDHAKAAREWEARFLAMEEELRRVRGEKNEGE